MRSLKFEEWQDLRISYLHQVEPWLQQHQIRRAAGKKHPVYDFLFEYYSVRPARLREWTPGIGVVLEGAGREDVFSDRAWHFTEEGAWIDCEQFPQRRLDSLLWVIGLLRAINNQKANFGCFGLHEWAMVYRSSSLRHNYSLRVSEHELEKFLESREIHCSHFDAFRFFSEEARPLNVLQPNSSTRYQLEQPGCVHVNMDLYKWAMKFHPWVSSETVLHSLNLAISARELDMRASPYDLRELGFDPIRIETIQGREEYALEQKKLSDRAVILRRQLLSELENLNNYFAGNPVIHEFR